MLCRKCNKEQATFFLSRDTSEEGAKVGFCDACADEVGIFAALQKVESLLHGYGLNRPASGVILDPTMPIEFADSCSVCGTELASFEHDFQLGCDNCCHIFGSLLFNYVSLLSPSPLATRLRSLYPGLPPAPAKKSRKVIPLATLAERLALAAENEDTQPQPGMAPVEAKHVARLLHRSRLNPDPLDPWLQTRIETRRNFSDAVFPARMAASQRQAVMQHVSEVLALSGASTRRLLDTWRLSPLQRLALERRFFDRSLSVDSSLIINRSPQRMILANDEDHLVFIYQGQERAPEKAVRAATADLKHFDNFSDFAFSPRFGYLTAAPRNMGAAMSVSVLLHLPFSLTRDQLQFFPSRADRAGVRFEPFCGRGLERHGFFRISSLVPYNADETEIAARVFGFAESLVEEERKARGNLSKSDANRLKKLMDQVLSHSRRSYRLSYQDVLRFTTFLTLGHALGASDFHGFSLGKVIPAMSSPYIMFKDKRRYTVNECEQRRADLFADLIELWTNPLLRHPRKKAKS